MRTTCAAGRLGSSRHSTWSANNSEKKRPGLFLSRTPWRPSKDANCRTFLNCRMNSRFRGANAFSFFRFLTRRTERHSGPSVQDAQDFANHVESAAGRAPPATGLKGVVRSGPNNRLSAACGEPLPENSRPPCVDFTRYDDHGASFFLRQCYRGCRDFVRRVHDGRLKQANGVGRYAFVHQNLLVVDLLPGVDDAHRGKRGTWLRRVGQPYLWGVAFSIQFRGFPGSHGHASTKDEDGLRFFKWVFHDQPAADAQEKDGGNEQQQTNNAKAHPAASPALARRDFRIIAIRHSRTVPRTYSLPSQSQGRVGASYPPRDGWSIRRTHATLTGTYFWEAA